jgi:diaminopimelate epimerase
MKFWKMNGAGNDFIIINNIEERIPVEKFPRVARTLCERRLSIGADGLMAVDLPTQGGDYRMLFYNSDGSAGEMCGNGARCICRYGVENKLAGDKQVLETPAGIVIGWRITDRLYRIRLNDPSVVKLEYDLPVDGRTYECSYVELGNPGLPHAVVHYPGLADKSEKELWGLGNALRHHKAFPKGANVNFYDILEDGTILEKTFERGVEDFTYACGTGTGSTALVLTLKGIVDGGSVRVRMRGGELSVDVERTGDRIANLFLTGPTNVVAAGEVLDEDLDI